MERLGLSRIGNNTYETFYNKNRRAIDYFYKDEENKDVICCTVIFDELKRVIKGVSTIKSFKRNYNNICKLVLLNEKLFERVGDFQTFPIDVWEDCVMTRFKDIEVEFIPYIGKKN